MRIWVAKKTVHILIVACIHVKSLVMYMFVVVSFSEHLAREDNSYKHYKYHATILYYVLAVIISHYAHVAWHDYMHRLQSHPYRFHTYTIMYLMYLVQNCYR